MYPSECLQEGDSTPQFTTPWGNLARAVQIRCLLHYRQDFRRILEGVQSILDGGKRILDGVHRILEGIHRILVGVCKLLEGVYSFCRRIRTALVRCNAHDAIMAGEDGKAVREGRQGGEAGRVVGGDGSSE